MACSHLLLRQLQLQLVAVLLIISSCCCSSTTPLQHAGAAAAAAHHRHRPKQMVWVQGFVICDACQESRLSNFSLPIPGATILLTCKNTRHPSSTSNSFTKKATSNMYGAFSFAIPFSKPRLLRRCLVELTHSPFEACITQTRFSRRPLAPISRAKSKGNARLAYSSGWLSYQPKSLPSFCSAIPREEFTNHGSVRGRSKDTVLSPEDLPNFFPPVLPGTTPTFPFNLFPPLPNIPGLTPPTIPGFPGFTPPTFPGFPGLTPPIIPGFPPFPQFPPYTNFPGFPPFPSYSFPFPFSFPPFPPVDMPPNPFSPSNPTNPFTNPTPTFNVPPMQLPPLPPGLPSIPPFGPTPTNPLSSPSPVLLPPVQFPSFPPFSPIPILPPSNPTNP